MLEITNRLRLRRVEVEVGQSRRCNVNVELKFSKHRITLSPDDFIRLRSSIQFVARRLASYGDGKFKLRDVLARNTRPSLSGTLYVYETKPSDESVLEEIESAVSDLVFWRKRRRTALGQELEVTIEINSELWEKVLR